MPLSSASTPSSPFDSGCQQSASWSTGDLGTPPPARATNSHGGRGPTCQEYHMFFVTNELGRKGVGGGGWGDQVLLTPLPRGMRLVCLFRVPQFIMVQSSGEQYGVTGAAPMRKYILNVRKGFRGEEVRGHVCICALIAFLLPNSVPPHCRYVQIWQQTGWQRAWCSPDCQSNFQTRMTEAN